MVLQNSPELQRDDPVDGLTKALLGGVALSALTNASAIAEHKHPAFSFMALHAGRMVNKTKLHNQGATHLTYTFGVYSYFLPVLDKKVPLATFYKWNSSGTLCSSPPEKEKFNPKKTLYGKLSRATETYSEGCSSGPTTFYGADYKLTDPNGFGRTDYLNIILIGKYKNSGTTYKGTLNLDITAFLEK